MISRGATMQPLRGVKIRKRDGSVDHVAMLNAPLKGKHLRMIALADRCPLSGHNFDDRSWPKARVDILHHVIILVDDRPHLLQVRLDTVVCS